MRVLAAGIVAVWLGGLMLSAPLVWAQKGSQTRDLQPDPGVSSRVVLQQGKQRSSFSLLDPRRMSISHSYTIGYHGGNGASGSFGLYTNIIRYQVSSEMTLKLRLGYLHRPFSGFGTGGYGSGSVLVPGFGFKYKPNKHLQIQFEYNAWVGQRFWPIYSRDDY